ncbi:unnamed protein product, partial [Brenthis ino]
MSSRPISTTAANLIEASQLRRRYYSAQVYAQTQVHSLLRPLSYPVDNYYVRPFDTTGARSGAGPTALPALRGKGKNNFQLPNSGLLLRLS